MVDQKPMSDVSTGCFPSQPQVITQIEEPIDRSEVLRYLGYPQGVDPTGPVADAVDRWIEESRSIAEPRAIYVVLPVVAQDRRWIRVESTAGMTEFRGAIGEFLGSAELIAPFIATAGPQVERRASELLHENDDLGAMILNAVGAERAEAAEGVVIEQLRARATLAHLAPTLPYSPGYCGMDLLEQRKLFAILDGATIGVTLSAKCLMRPLKSISGLIGLGPRDTITSFQSPCDRCELHNCSMRR